MTISIYLLCRSSTAEFSRITNEPHMAMMTRDSLVDVFNAEFTRIINGLMAMMTVDDLHVAHPAIGVNPMRVDLLLPSVMQ